MKVLVVDDDRDLVEMLNFALRRAGFETIHAADGPTVQRLLETESPGLVLLDVNIGAWNGFDILQALRARTNVPVIMLTGRGEEEDRVRGLTLGADDYVIKPFSYRELIARIQANLRRYEAVASKGAQRTAGRSEAPERVDSQLTVGPLSLDPATHVVTKHDRPVKVTVTEFKLLQCLMERAGSVVPTRRILREVWGFEDPSGADLVRVTTYRLRRKLEDNPSQPQLLQTVPGVGVMIKG